MNDYIICLPYWNPSEIDNYLQILSRWQDFCDSKVNYRFLIARRFDVDQDIRLFKCCENYAPTEEFSCDSYPWVGHPAGANGMFKSVVEHVYENYGSTGGFMFWFEHDIIPIHANWLNYLADWWSERYLFMGQFVTQEWINENGLNGLYTPYYSGSACFNKGFLHTPIFSKINESISFDTFTTKELSLYGNIVNNIPHLFDLFFFMPPWSKTCNLNKLMVNGAKNYDQRKGIIKYILENRA